MSCTLSGINRIQSVQRNLIHYKGKGKDKGKGKGIYIAPLL